ncbi:MAG TPA: hypothetical protein VLW55_05135 [Burkholderiaceae bacterium]|nr:hypothetical protein [Burkholderiaceae bacterium]
MIAALAEHLPRLLQRPSRARVRGHVQVRQAARALLDDDEYVEHAERGHDSHEEVAGEYGRRMVLQERRPALVAAWLPARSFRHVLVHGSRRDTNAQFEQQFVGDPFFAPKVILMGHPANQRA